MSPRPAERARTVTTKGDGGGHMASVLDVAAYILRKRGPMSAMKLQKLCYYAYAYHLAWEERPLFRQPFEAWANGPVVPDLYARHRGLYRLSEGDIPGDPMRLDQGERESVDLVLLGLGDFTAHQLSQMTHQESPWLNARMRAGVQPLERSGEKLRDDEILEFFDAITAATADAEEED
jgi:uncharacterized phage-associated protein